ncbi:MAG: hypothetical protein N2201_05285 [candidate division WOR-3 bacterium]|nr:hypothetical protein [candidate division WOR-3 bacterium]
MKIIKWWLLLFSIGLGEETAQPISLDIKKVTPRTIISVVKRIEQEYYLLTKERPIDLAVTGPTYIRVYTRLLWRDDMTGKQNYRLLLKHGEDRNGQDEKLLTFETEKSNTAIGENKTRYSKWRSFYLEVPSGINQYQISLVSAPSETVALRFSFEKPKEYKKITPEQPYKELQFVEWEKIITYYEITKKQPVKVKVTGPAILKATCRLNYDYTLEGKQSYTISASVSGKEWQAKTFRTEKSQTGMYKNQPAIIPSTPNNFYLDVPPGNFIIEFNLKAGLGKSAGISFSVKAKDTYE